VVLEGQLPWFVRVEAHATTEILATFAEQCVAVTDWKDLVA
jgi:hypothetical protein